MLANVERKKVKCKENANILSVDIIVRRYGACLFLLFCSGKGVK